MARYIDAEPLPHGSLWDSYTHKEKAKILAWILSQPTADVVEVKHGEWLPQIVLGQRAWDCSECKILGSPQWKWCPVCGAKMDGERRDT